ncbi:MAG: hypothetical protein FWF12_00285 [Betaproteobacteria bacterium]|nr:hypothetical protein [Betaproteobacteria bacterium]
MTLTYIETPAPDYFHFERELDAIVELATSPDFAWCTSLQELRVKIDKALSDRAITQREWNSLVRRSANIQDMLNGD